MTGPAPLVCGICMALHSLVAQPSFSDRHQAINVVHSLHLAAITATKAPAPSSPPAPFRGLCRSPPVVYGTWPPVGVLLVPAVADLVCSPAI